MYEIYLHTNLTTNKIYIGYTGVGMTKRWKLHVRKAKHLVKKGGNRYFYNALVKHGPDDWTHEIIEDNIPTLDEAEIAEIKWIAHYDSNNRKIGYNSTKGGKVSRNHFNPEVIAKISATATKNENQPEVKARKSAFMKEWHKTNPNPFLGKKHTEESKKIMSEKSRKYNEEHGNAFAGKTHTKETKEKISRLFKERFAKPGWKPSFVGRISKEMVLSECQVCTTQAQLAQKFNCTSGNIYYLLKHFDIRDQVKSTLKQNKLRAKLNNI